MALFRDLMPCNCCYMTFVPLLLSQLKTLRLKELAEDIERQKQMSDAKGKRVLSDQTGTMGNAHHVDCEVARGHDQEKLDEMWGLL